MVTSRSLMLFLVNIWEGAVEGSPTGGVVRSPDDATMGLNDRPDDGEPHPHTGRLRGVERLEEQLLRAVFEARPAILHRHVDALGLGGGPDAHGDGPVVPGAFGYGFHGVEQEIQDNLL